MTICQTTISEPIASSKIASQQELPYLLGHTCLAPTKHSIPSQRAGEETIISTLLPDRGRIDAAQYDHRGLVDEREGCQIPSMLARGFQDKFGFLAEAASLHQYTEVTPYRMRGPSYVPDRKRNIILSKESPRVSSRFIECTLIPSGLSRIRPTPERAETAPLRRKLRHFAHPLLTTGAAQDQGL